MSGRRVLKKTVSVAALRHNWRVIRRRATARRLLAVVKSNAYGHGLTTVAGALRDLADGFAVVRIEDAIALRQFGVESPIVLLQGIFRADDAPLLVEHRLTPVAHSAWQISAIAALPASAALSVYLKINTGMNRLGFEPAAAADALSALQQTPAVSDIVLMTHFADADADDNADNAAGENGENGLSGALRQIAPWRAHGLPLSLGNSAATLLHTGIGDDIARVGIALYGASPAPTRPDAGAAALGLRPAMTFASEIIAIRQVAAGGKVGYGGEYIAARDTPVGIVSAGYGDGYPRAKGLFATAPAANNTRLPVIGRVSMEMLALDLTAHPQATIGDTITLWGDTPTADDLATAANTIAYDLFTRAKGEFVAV